MAAVYPYGPIAAPVLDEQFLQHDMVEDTNTTLLDLLAHWAGDLGRDVLDCVAPARPLVAGRWLCLDTAFTREERRPQAMSSSMRAQASVARAHTMG